MCDKCNDLIQRLYPQLGENSEFHVREFKATMINASTDLGIKIVQERTVDYMGEIGVETREELHVVYIPWDKLLEIILDLGEIYTAHAPHAVKFQDALRILKDGEDDT